MPEHRVTFQPEGIRVVVETGTTLLEAAQQAGIVLNSVCGGQGTCKKCLVEVAGIGEPQKACQYCVKNDLTVTVPESSRFFEQVILEEGTSHKSLLDPPVQKFFLEMEQTSLEDLRSDAIRLIEVLNVQAGKIEEATEQVWEGTAHKGWILDKSVLGTLPKVLRDNQFAVTAVCHEKRVIALEGGDTTKEKYGLAVDIGTTTVVASLINLNVGKTAAVASMSNPQISFGDDVIGRIEFSTQQADGLQQLQKKIIDALNDLIKEASAKAKVDPQRIYEMTAVGNSTMQQLFLGIPVESIAQAPYVSTVSTAVKVPAGVMGIGINPAGNVYVMPTVAGHVGGDTVAVTLATGLGQRKEIDLALDIGTNGELVLGNRERLAACSTAAGPAFEGARIGQGMRGTSGAIERVHIKNDVTVSVIGGGEAKGICGSGLIDALAELLKAGIVDSSGRILSGDELPQTVSENLRKRVVTIENQPAFVLAHASDSKNGGDILLTQRDIREAQLAKAAIRAGIIMLLKHLAIEKDDIDRIFLAGAFGNYIRPESARRIGLLPDIPLEKIQFAGNAASAGAKEVLLGRETRRQGEVLAGQIEYVELAGRGEFQALFSDCIFFPEE